MPLTPQDLLRIRFTRTGKNTQPSFRIVVAEHARAVKRKYTEILGHYLPARQPKEISLKKDRIEYWLSVGAKPSDSVAVLLKKEGFSDMDKFIEPRTKKRKKKKAEEEKKAAPAASAAAPVEAPAKAAEAPAEEKAPEEKEEKPAPEEKAPEEKAPSAPSEPVEEPKKEEAKSES